MPHSNKNRRRIGLTEKRAEGGLSNGPSNDRIFPSLFGTDVLSFPKWEQRQNYQQPTMSKLFKISIARLPARLRPDSETMRFRCGCQGVCDALRTTEEENGRAMATALAGARRARVKAARWRNIVLFGEELVGVEGD